MQGGVRVDGVRYREGLCVVRSNPITAIQLEYINLDSFCI